MTTMSANLRTCERALVFQITDQDLSIDNYINLNGTFTATNGWTIRKANCPEIDVLTKTIFLRGDDFDKRRRVSSVWDLSSQSKAETIVSQVDTALREFVNVVANSVMKCPRIARYGMDKFDFSTPLSNESRTNYSSNKPTITA